MNLSPNIDFQINAAAATSAGTAVEGAAVDMTGFIGVYACASIATANAGNLLKIQQSDTTTGADFEDIPGASAIATANNGTVEVDVYNPTKRYVRGVIIRAGTNTATTPIHIHRYGPRLAATQIPTAGGVRVSVTG